MTVNQTKPEMCYANTWKSLESNPAAPINILQGTQLLDSLMQNNYPTILDLFSDNVSFGHSNGWVQNKDDFKTDFESGKVKYQSVKQSELANIRRIIAVKGLYKNEIFTMNLSVLELWIREKGIWKLWSRQSVGLKS